MKEPGAVLREQLGGLDNVVIRGVTYVLSAEVAIDPKADMEELLLDNVERVAKWERLAATCRATVDRLEDELETERSMWTVQFWAALEKGERDEMQAKPHDETELEQDRADAAAGDDGFKIRRSQRHAARVTMGVAAGRWRRNFSDDILRARVNSAPEMIRARQALREAKSQLHKANCVLRTIEHRSRCISHLCALHRDQTRQ